jgi:hypothetical protein
MDGSGFAAGPRDANGRFAAGSPGRRLGSRNLVSKRVARAILADFEVNQDELLKRSRRWFMPQYLSMISRLLPRQSEEGGLELETLERAEALAIVAAVRAAADRYEAGVGSIEALEAALMGEGVGGGGEP